MAADEEVIRQRIILDGADGALKELQQLGDEGAKAIDKIKAAGGGDFASGLRKISPEIAALQDNFAKVEIAASRIAPAVNRAATSTRNLRNAATGSTDPLKEGLAESATEARNANQEIKQLGRVLRGLGRATGIQEISGLARTLRGVSVAAGLIAGPAIIGGLGLIANSSANATQLIQDLAFAAGQLPQIFQATAGAALAVGGSTEEFAKALSKTPALIKQTAANELSLAAADSALHQTRQKSRDDSQKLLDALRPLAEAQRALNVEQLSGTQSAAAYHEKELDIAEQFRVNKISADVYRKSVDKLRQEQLNSILAQQAQQRALDLQVKAANKAIREQDDAARAAEISAQAAKRAQEENATALQKLGVSASQFKALSMPEQFKLVADRLAQMPPGIKRNALALELFGQDARKFVAELDKGKSSFDSFIKEGERIAPAFTPAQNAIGDDFVKATGQFIAAMGALKNAFGLAVAPAFLDFFKTLTEVVVNARPAFEELGKTLGSILKPVLDGIGAVLTNVIVPLFSTVTLGFEGLAKVINSTFGTNTNGVQLFTIALIALGAAFFPITSAVTLILILFGQLTKALAGVNFGDIAKRAQASFASILQKGTDLWLQLEAMFFAGRQIIVGIWNSVGTAFANAGASIIAGATTLWAQITSLWTQAVDGVAALWNTVVDAFHSAFDPIVQFVADIMAGIATLFNDAAILISNAFNTSIDFIRGKWEQFKSFLSSWVTTVIDFFQPLIDMIKKIAAFFSSSPDVAAAGGAPGFARGGSPGLVQGPGTSVSDSILAWLSNNEFVMQAKAVRKYGVGFMHAINAGRLSLESLKGFSVGGLAQAMSPGVGAFNLPAFANGGLADGMKPVSITFEGTTFEAMMTDNTIGQLSRKAIRGRANRAGRAPSWVGG